MSEIEGKIRESLIILREEVKDFWKNTEDGTHAEWAWWCVLFHIDNMLRILDG